MFYFSTEELLYLTYALSRGFSQKIVQVIHPYGQKGLPKGQGVFSGNILFTYICW